MQRTESLAVMKALADETRLELLHFLAERPRYGEELSAQLQLSASTVSFHLHKLEEAGLVRKTKDQYYMVYSINEELLDLPVRKFFAFDQEPHAMHDIRLESYRRKVLTTFIKSNTLRQLPTQKKKRLIVLEYFAHKFALNVIYGEKEVNAKIEEHYPDYCTIRRELIDEHYLARDGQRYRRTGELPPHGALDERTQKKEEPAMGTTKEMKQYKLMPRTAGVYQIRNNATGKIFLGSSLNLHGPWNRHKFQLSTGSHSNVMLQADWKTYGPEHFSFDILATVKEDPERNTSDELKKLEELWTAKLDPYGENGYNSHNTVKRIREA